MLAPSTTVYIPGNGRLHFKSISGRVGAWAAGNLRDNGWFQVDFGRWVTVMIISTQGREDAHQWVTKYTVTYSYDGLIFWGYKEGGLVKVPFEFGFVDCFHMLCGRFRPFYHD